MIDHLLSPVDFDPFAGPTIEKVVPLTESQQEIWLSCVLGGTDANLAYNESISLDFNGSLQSDKFEESLAKLLVRHESLRTSFSADGRNMIIYTAVPLKFTLIDLSALPAQGQAVTIGDFHQKDAETPFNLSEAPLIQFTLFKKSNTQYLFTIKAHHIICDGWSLGAILEDLSKIYNANFNNTPLPKMPLAYGDYVSHLLAFTKTEEYAHTERYWLDKYKNIPQLALPLDFPRPKKRTFKSKRDDYRLDKEFVGKIKELGAKVGSSFVTTLLTAYEVFIHRLTGQDDIVIGLPAAGQSATGHFSLVGHCVNLLPIKSEMNSQASFLEHLKRRKSEILDDLDHQQVTFGTLIKKLNIKRDPSQVPLVSLVFNIDMGMDTGVSFYGVTHRLISNPRKCETFDIFLNVSGAEDALTLEWSYNTQLFTPETIASMMKRFTGLLNTIIAQPTIRLADIKINENIEQAKATQETVYPYPKDKPFTAYITEIAAEMPDKTAISFNGKAISYHELETRSSQLANYLIAKDITVGDIIGVAMDRSIDMVIALLGVIKSGAAYIPLDPNYPVNRIEFMLQDSSAKLLLTESKYSRLFSSQAKELLYDELIAGLNAYTAETPQPALQGSDLVYVLYTSGSTGKPKGVQIEHHNLANLLLSMQREPGVTAADKLLALTTISFDIAGLELYLPLISGATMILADADMRLDSYRILNIVKSEAVTILQATPATWRMMLESGWSQRLGIKCICGGEAFPPDLAEKLLDLCDEVWNGYGPTETTIYSIIKRIRPNELPITIGKPIANTQAYILDETLSPLGMGQEGEICIGGAGVARGYLNRPELNADRFLPDPFAATPGTRFYRTGDLGKVLPNGEIQCLGRIDTQVKIRGFRIELGEIEYHLNKQKGIKESIVIAREDRPGDQRLVAYLLPIDDGKQKSIPQSGTPADKESIRRWKQELASALPSYMVPNDWVLLSEFPLTPNKKVDRKALPKPPSAITFAADTANGSALTANEQKVLDIWASIFKTTDIQKDDDFFELGGHSLLALDVMLKIEKETGVKLPLASLFEHPTIERLAILLDNEKTIKWDCLVPIKPDGKKNPLYIVHGAGLNVLLFNTLTAHLDKEQPIYGLQARGLNGEEEPFTSIPEMAAHYISEILSQNPTGPYALSGFSLGGLIAYEMAKQLLEMGKEVRMLAMFDTFSYETDKFLPWYIKYPKRFGTFSMKVLHSFYLLAKDPKDTVAYKYTSIKRRVIRLYWKITGKSDDVIGFFGYLNKVDKINNEAVYNYVLEPIDLDIHVFRATIHRFYAKDFKYLGWKKFAKKGVKIYNIPGEHNLIFAPPNDKDFGRILQKVLDEN
ncbi:non-ribosomal peptide synthetase [Parapedobacter lycopersici]|uniref:non-ribosomal peptide synthetase n=1 Tax=Parapedobacter lycopersici TaxID=1864939 RepID=UPI00214D3FAE|nr:non-ribosomal peptide synthetase [Parapedobacter lycopersici]